MPTIQDLPTEIQSMIVHHSRVTPDTAGVLDEEWGKTGQLTYHYYLECGRNPGEVTLTRDGEYVPSPWETGGICDYCAWFPKLGLSHWEYGGPRCLYNRCVTNYAYEHTYEHGYEYELVDSDGF